MNQNVRTGIVVGLIMATLYSAYVIVLFAVSGPQPFDVHRTTIQAVVATYYAVGVVGGAVVGALSPLNRSLPGRLIVGIAAALVVFFCIALATEGPFWRWNRAAWQDVGILSLIFGVAGSIAWRKFVRF